MNQNNEETDDQNKLLIEKLVEVTTENNILRGCGKHILRLGIVSVEVIPVSKMSLTNIFSEFTKFAEKMKELHGDEHLKATIVHSTENEQTPEVINPEMFG